MVGDPGSHCRLFKGIFLLDTYLAILIYLHAETPVDVVLQAHSVPVAQWIERQIADL